MFCKNCGAEINDKAAVCVKCGVAVEPVEDVVKTTTSNGVDWLIAVLLCLFLGTLGVHRFYTKNTSSAVVLLIVSMVSCGIIGAIWALVDLVLLLTGNFKTGDGSLLKR